MGIQEVAEGYNSLRFFYPDAARKFTNFGNSLMAPSGSHSASLE